MKLFYTLCAFLWGNIFFFCPATFYGQEGVPLYLEPNEASVEVVRLSRNSESFDDAQPLIVDELRDMGWFLIEYNGPIQGLVDVKEIRANFTLPIGTAIYTHSEDDEDGEADILTTVQKDDRIQVITPVPASGYAGVVVQKSMTLYFMKQAGQIFKNAPKPKSPAPFIRYFEGIFKRHPYKHKSEYRYILVGPEGRKIAYIDIKDINITASINKYVGETVIIQGIPEKIKGNPPLVIRASSMRLK